MNKKGFSAKKSDKIVTWVLRGYFFIACLLVIGYFELRSKLLYYYYDESMAYNMAGLFLVVSLLILDVIAFAIMDITEVGRKVYFCRKITHGQVYSHISNIYVTRNYIEFEYERDQTTETVNLPYDSYSVKTEARDDIDMPVFFVKDDVVTKLYLPKGHLWNEYKVRA